MRKGVNTMKYYLIYDENTYMWTINCYANDELLVVKRVYPLLSVLTEKTDSCYMLSDFENLQVLYVITSDNEFYVVYNNRKIKVSFKSFITSLKYIINGEN